MEIRKVEVSFIFEGIIKESENMQGVLFQNKVFLNDDECGPGLYAVEFTDNPDKVIVDLDANSEDYLAGKAELLIDLLTA